MCGTISGTIHRFTYQTFFSRSVLSGVFAVAVRHSLRHKGSKPKSGGGRGCVSESACSGLRKSFWISKTDTLPFVKWTKRQGVRLFSSIGRKTKMQTNEMFAFWKGGATEQARDGFLNKKSRREPVQSATTCVFSTLWINCQIRKTKSQSSVSDCDFGRSCDEMSEK